MKANICAVQHVELPGWEEGVPFRAELRRPSLLSMAADGVIPNELLSAAQKLFSEGFDSDMPLDKLGRLLRSVAKEALVNPTMQELEEQGCFLTDVQLAAIYSFTQAGVRALEPFRERNSIDNPAGHEQAVRSASEPNT